MIHKMLWVYNNIYYINWILYTQVIIVCYVTNFLFLFFDDFTNLFFFKVY